jgi:hypothetical protein
MLMSRPFRLETTNGSSGVEEEKLDIPSGLDRGAWFFKNDADDSYVKTHPNGVCHSGSDDIFAITVEESALR